MLLEEAGRLNATDLTRAGRRVARRRRPHHTDRTLEQQLEREERAAHPHRHLSITPDGAGGVRLKGRGSAEDAAILRAALLPDAPHRSLTVTHGTMAHASRDALVASPNTH